MASFSKKERIIASILSATPGLKAFIKNLYIKINAVVHKKKYTLKLLTDPVKIRINDPLDNFNKKFETFGGYYDSPTINGKGQLLSHATESATTGLPVNNQSVQILLTDIQTGDTKKVASSSSYNWQQGARLHWLNNDLFVFNDFDKQEKKYRTQMYSVSQRTIIKTFNYPVQASFKNDFFLAINYERLMNVRPDYGYRCLPLLSSEEMNNLHNDGIWKINYTTGHSILLHTLKDVTNVDKKEIFDSCTHSVNHLIISPDGGVFIFIHRYYQDKRRYDRLMYSDYKSLKVLIDEEYVSHCCWVGNNKILGYLRANNKNGYYFIDINTETFSLCSEMTDLDLGDGHPSHFQNWVVFDSYPDKSRMQRLLMFDIKQDKIYTLAELFQSTKYSNETRCDLHPRFSIDGRFISFDTVFKGKRRQCIVRIEELKNSL